VNIRIVGDIKTYYQVNGIRRPNPDINLNITSDGNMILINIELGFASRLTN